MAKKIPKSLKRSIVKALLNEAELTPAQVSERVNADPELPENYRKTPKQMAFVMNQVVKELNGVEMVVLSRNGVSHHGNERFRKAYRATYETLDEAEEELGVLNKPTKRLKQITVNLPDDCVAYIKAWRKAGVSAGRAVENLIRADMEANGLPHSRDDKV